MIENTPLGTVIFNVVTPTLTAYLPDRSKATGTGIIIAPGGAFVALAIDLEVALRTTIAPPHRHRLPRKTPLLWKWETEAVSDAYTSAGPACCHPNWSPGFDSHLVLP